MENHNVAEYLDAASNRYDLSKGAKCLLYDLITIWNRWSTKGQDWDGWFHATDRGEGRYVIGERWGTDTYARYRKELEEKKCIAVDRGFSTTGKKKCRRYKLLLLD